MIKNFVPSIIMKKEINMEKIGDMEFIDFEDVLDRDLGKIGTPKRDEFERKVDESVRANRFGEQT